MANTKNTQEAMLPAMDAVKEKTDINALLPNDAQIFHPEILSFAPYSKSIASASSNRFVKSLRYLGFVAAVAAMVPMVSMTISTPVIADDTGTPTPPPPVVTSIAKGDKIINPLTGEEETVLSVRNVEYDDEGNVTDASNADYSVVYTEEGNIIFRAIEVGMQYYAADADNPATTVLYEVTSLTMNGTGDVVGVVLTKVGADPADTDAVLNLDVVTPQDPQDGDNVSGGTGHTNVTDFASATGDNNYLTFSQRGARGGNGSDGGGIRMCFGIFGCVTIGKNPSRGGAGADGPDITEILVGGTNPDIETVSNNRPGIVISSIGGDGGNGGDGWGANIKPAQGGKAGAGGDIHLETDYNITTSGDDSHAIFAQSRSGNGGTGGDGNIASGAGLGGEASPGGTVYVENSGNLFTEGTGSSGIFAQSLGGGAGNGGDSNGIVADAGEGNLGGTGGNVTVINHGTIGTKGNLGYGIFAQSIGGSGGNSGDAGGLVSFGESGQAGGAGGNVTVETSDTSVITTQGHSSHGIFAQSIGGGGGSAGKNSSVVALGAGGGSGGDGGDVTVTNKGIIETLGDISRGIFAQSIGGGGGSGGDAGGLVSIGGAGGIASKSGTVKIVNTGTIITGGNKSDGIFAQSVGGGGGEGGTSGGSFLTIGGGGGAGGDGGLVVVDHEGAINTTGDDSRGIFAQSVGGGGGSGGNSSAGSAFVGVAIGGEGGDGGDGQETTITFISTQETDTDGEIITHLPIIVTEGDRSTGVMAQSVGGGGGNGGYAISAVGGYGVSASVAVGGSGGKGGQGGTVNLDGHSYISTAGDFADGMLLQSIGGGGGNGGMSMSFSFAAGETAAAAFAVSLGGSGGDGGMGGEVIVTSGGKIYTAGDYSNGLVTQSIGGGGGNGGFSMAVSGAAAGAASGSFAVGLGGSGGKGGIGQLVHTTYDGTIETHGDHSTAAIIQSVGGGGGSGGYNISGAISLAGKAAVAAAVGIGGSGGEGGDGGQVIGVLKDKLDTYGDFSAGAVIQSIGGGGGSGGMNISGSIAGSGDNAAAVAVGLGGAGGDGGDADTVNATVSSVHTRGDHSGGIIAQSVGGGGGNGGMNISGAISISQKNSTAVAVGIGGLGGGGGNAGVVTADVDGDVVTEGDHSTGIIAQSLGGGGGNGGMNISGSVAIGGEKALPIAVGIGGFGGDGGYGSAVELNATGTVITSGHQSGAIMAQSLGGGGGNGGVNISGTVALTGEGDAGAVSVGIGGFGGAGGDAGAVTLTRIGDTQTSGTSSDAIIAQSLGGGGGNGGMNISAGLSFSSTGNAASLGVGIGGFGDSGGDAADATANITGSVYALGVDDAIDVLDEDGNIVGQKRANGSNAILVQSLGGGGGNGGMNVSGQLSFSAPSTGKSRTLGVGIGGFGDAGGDAGTATLNLNGTVDNRSIIRANGDDKSAVTVQSIGGGGGNGGMNITGGISMDGSAQIGIGGFGGGGGKGGNVLANIDADIYTAGNRSRGILAQSVGGGGGNGAINITGSISANKNTGDDPSVAFGLGGFGGAGNTSGEVKLSQNGSIIVEGVSSIGILAQSVGGGGGDGGMNVTANVNMGSQDSGSYAASVGVGGKGGTGGDANIVDVSSIGDIVVNAVLATDDNGDVITDINGNLTFTAATFTGDSVGILVQSVGGGGGNGGANITGVAAPGGNPFAIGVGGSGNSGGDAASVTLMRGYEIDVNGDKQLVGGNLVTFGNDSDGIVVQSVGGGGGRAGANVVLAGSNKENSYGANVNVGGDGGGAGNGDVVNVLHGGNILTHGDSSNGIVAQSIGGGGGNANYNLGLAKLKKGTGLALNIGGTPGAAGSGDEVTVSHVGNIVTMGRRAMAIIAQSIGGGGGNVKMDKSMAAGTDNALNIKLGQQGGTGGEAGNVSVTSDGLLETFGDESNAIMAQSIGGGGGASGTTSIGVKATSDQNNKTTGNLSVGIEGGSGAEGGNVEINTDGTIITRGDEARAIFAQSIGGGGGIGGSATTTVRNSNISGQVAVGGAGGTGAVSGDVDINNKANIETFGDKSDAIFAQSIGGGGGIGGKATSRTLQMGENVQNNDTYNMVVNVGGSGGIGAISGNIDVTNEALVITRGDYAYGIRAQAIGGGGGQGGAVLRKAVEKGAGSQSVALNIGGAGGTGAAAGHVVVTNEGRIYTFGHGAIGIAANSIGGGGGDGGNITDITTGKNTNAQSHRLTMNVGGNGGDGGIGGNVDVFNRKTATEFSGEIVTEGDDAYGIIAQSIGGGGGNGSSILSMSGMKTGTESAVFGLNIGGFGGAGNVGGLVKVLNQGLIYTQGKNAHGIIAQSIGGGGGNGGAVVSANLMMAQDSASPLISVGGGGGDGGNGNNVTVTNDGEILTRGEFAHGIIAQSVGGGGGNAGLTIAATRDAGSIVLNRTISAILGGLGSSHNGVGGEVKVTHNGDITVTGKGSQAIIAQSINGGGGTLLLDLDGLRTSNLTGIAANDPSIIISSGGQSSVDMVAGKVEVISTGTFGATGDSGAASQSQAIGGGGGTTYVNLDLTKGFADDDADFGHAAPLSMKIALGAHDGSGNSGETIANDHEGSLVTTGYNTYGILEQSIGGGGGRTIVDVTSPDGTSVNDFTVTMGAANEINSQGGKIDRKQKGDVVTTGDYAYAAVWQSIGGGGGVADLNMRGQGVDFAMGQINMGAQGGFNLDADTVKSVVDGVVMTTGDYASALVAQSIGGGGGYVINGANAYSETSMGGDGGTNGDGGDITITSNDVILSRGRASHGAFLQSIGGGGGAVFGEGANPYGVTMNNDNTGDGGDIVFSQSGGIYVEGDASYGVMAQSLGGGGGWVDGGFANNAGGNGFAGDIMLTLKDLVAANGAESVAVFAQSRGGSNGNQNGNITLTLEGDVYGGSGQGAGVIIDGGHDNTVDVSGVIVADSGRAIIANESNDAVNNTGHIIGNIDLGGGHNVFHNQVGGIFNSYNSLNLHDGSMSSTGTFINDGIFSVGLQAPIIPEEMKPTQPEVENLLQGQAMFRTMRVGPDPVYQAQYVETLTINGDFIQNAGAHTLFDVAFGPYDSDKVIVTGDASLAGTASITLTWIEDLKPVMLFDVAGTTTYNNFVIENSLGMSYSLSSVGGATYLNAQTNLGQDFMNRNNRAMGRHMDSALQQGGAIGIGRVVGLLGNLNAGDEAAYTSVFNSVNPEPFMAPMVVQLSSSDHFVSRMFDCKPMGGKLFEGCSNFSVDKVHYKRDGGFENFAINGGTTQIGGNFEKPIGDGWSLLGALGYESMNNIRVDDNRATFKSNGANAAVGLRWTNDTGSDIGLSFGGGMQWIDAKRNVNVFDPEVGETSYTTQYATGGVRLGHTIGNDNVFFRAGLNTSVTAIRQGSFKEKGVDGLAIKGDSKVDVIGTLAPEISIGTVLENSNTANTTASLTFGTIHRTEDEIRMPYRIVGTSGDAAGATIGSSIDQHAYRVGADLNLWSADQYGAQLNFSHTFGDDSKEVSAGIRFNMKF